MVEVRRLPIPSDIAVAAACLAAEALGGAQKSQELATFVLAGGRLPPLGYEALSEKYAQAFDWRRVVFLIGDERCVPLDDPDSSWLGALPMFDKHPEIPEAHLLRPQSNLPAEQAAEAYTKMLRSLEANRSDLPILNHIWLGIGEDGHTLSLFPNHPSLALQTDELVVPVHDSPKPPPNRISLTFKALEGVQSAVVLISGTSKAPILAQIAAGDHSLPIVIASQTIDRAGGNVTWLIDDDAASQLPVGKTLDLSRL